MNQFARHLRWWVMWLIVIAMSISVRGQERFALLIGNSKYEPPSQRLQNPGNDADAMATVLEPLGFKVEKRKDLDLEQMEEALAEFRRRLTRASVALFFFAGHGLEVQGENYLLPVGANIREEYEVRRKCLPVGQVLDALKESESRLNIVILDSCRNNGVKRSWTRSSSSVGLAAIAEIPRGTLIAYATSPGAVAADGRGDNSPYTEHLCAVLRERPARGLELVDAFRETQLRVKRATDQDPWLNMGAIERFYLWRGAGLAEQPSEKPPTGGAPPLAVAPFNATAARVHQQAWARHLGQPVEVTNSIGMKFMLIPPGEFLMGSTVSAAEIHRRFPGGEIKWYEREHPAHKVRITRPYYLGTHEVSVADFERFVTATGYKTTAEKEGKSWGWKDGQWEEVEGLNWRQPGFDQQSTHPVTSVSWDDAMAFCQWLSRDDSRTYRLPTEAEWEYACRAGRDTLFFWGDDPDAGEGYLNAADETGTPDGRAWTYKFNFKDGYAATSPVGRFQPNAFGLHDMLGNVWEWCSDWYSGYASTPTDDPTGPTAGSARLSRGGGWSGAAGLCRSAYRLRFQPSYRISYLGFRLAFSSVDQSGQ